MDFRVGEAERELAEGIRTMVSGRLPLEIVRTREGEERTVTAEEWAALGETGVFALTLPEPEGTGLGLAEATVVFEELGRALVPGPLVGTFLAATTGLVPAAAEGRAFVGVCEGAGEAGATPWLVEHLSSLDAAFFLPDGGIGDGAGLMATIREASTARRVRAPLDPLTPMWHLSELPAAEPVDDPGRRLFRDGAILTGALQVGHAAACLDLAVAYAKERHQFGKPIGSFQAVKQRLAEMLILIESARSAAYAALEAAASQQANREPASREHTDDLEHVAAIAALMAQEAYSYVTAQTIQLHGGIGFTWEHDAHLYFKRARASAILLGTASELTDLIGRRLEAII